MSERAGDGGSEAARRRRVPRAVHLTRHAMRRYTERIRPGADMREAAIVLGDAIRRMTRTDERTLRGEALWSVDNPGMRLVTRHDPLDGMVLVTVLGPEERCEEDPAASPPQEPRCAKQAAEQVAAARRRALGLPAKSERQARAAALPPRCGASVVGQCLNLIGEYVSRWRRAHDGAGLCPDCDAGMERAHESFRTKG